MTQVAVLQPVEDVSVDQDELARIYIQMESADEIVAKHIQDLARCLPSAMDLFADGNLDDLQTCNSIISKISASIGMTTLSRVAQDVSTCCVSGDVAALAATLSRLVRIGECSLHEIWELQQLPI
ncbi:hypothetical protein [Shimia abyssi]|uniref:Hpt domain-containing protein n=1 Tax=Shimia abyssi TaxID=1662395 RepID=A0A2P8FKX4_9RHOB|nr:hypothetical protein [Shimia abyssi]PSL22325.1 hypothetical protein CLV88_101752 [Shimia abyssi]